MRAIRQEQVADVIRECRERLLAGDEDPAKVASRLEDVEAALLADIRTRRWVARATSQKLQVSAQHSPRQLRLPVQYFRTSAPSPATPISIVTPSYEQGEFLERTVASVLAQRYPAVEYVVRDGGSTDGSVEVLERFGGLRWHSGPDDGQADAINAGFAETTGDIMGFLNADDLLLPGALGYVARYFALNPDVDALYGHRVLIDEQDREIGLWVTPPHDDGVLDHADFMPSETLFWRRSAWERAGGRMDADLRFALDWDLLQRLRDSGARIVRVPRLLGAFRVHRDQKTHTLLDVCEQESAMLRERAAGRPVSAQEAHDAVQPYVRRHVVADVLFRARRRALGPTRPVMPFVLDRGVPRHS